MPLLKWALIFLVLAALAALFGFGGLAQGFADIAKILFFVFLVVFAVIGLLGVTIFRTVTLVGPRRQRKARRDSFDSHHAVRLDRPRSSSAASTSVTYMRIRFRSRANSIADPHRAMQG